MSIISKEKKDKMIKRKKGEREREIGVVQQWKHHITRILHIICILCYRLVTVSIRNFFMKLKFSKKKNQTNGFYFKYFIGEEIVLI